MYMQVLADLFYRGTNVPKQNKKKKTEQTAPLTSQADTGTDSCSNPIIFSNCQMAFQRRFIEQSAVSLPESISCLNTENTVSLVSFVCQLVKQMDAGESFHILLCLSVNQRTITSHLFR